MKSFLLVGNYCDFFTSLVPEICLLMSGFAGSIWPDLSFAEASILGKLVERLKFN